MPRTSRSRWYADYFGEDYLRIYDPFLTPEYTAVEVAAIIRLLGLRPGSSLLDLGCGYGRIAIPLAKAGFRVTGVDTSDFFLDLAKKTARQDRVAVTWKHADMRLLVLPAQVDVVLNMFTSFGYYDDETEDQKTLVQVAKALKPGGTFLFECQHRENVLSQYRDLLLPHSRSHMITRHDDGLVVLEERQFDFVRSRNNVTITLLLPEGGQRQYSHSIRLYTLREFIRMLSVAGLEFTAAYGSLDKRELDVQADRMVVVATKPVAGKRPASK